ncbi:MAG: V-type ATP synthase subunit I, partial [Treponema sp.]|nr:V-type ATP synthase subunit I [Treponema sp.]
MVLPMKKISLVVMEKEREESLKKLRSLGVVHLERKGVSSEQLTKLLDRKAKTEKALGILRLYAKDKKAAAFLKTLSGGNTGSCYSGDPEKLIREVLEYTDKKKYLSDRLANLGKERNRMAEWGEFDPKDISFLAEKGSLHLFLYKFLRKDFDNLPGDARYIVLGGDKHSIRLAVFDKELPGKNPFVPGEHSIKEIDSFFSDIHGELEDIERQLSVLSLSCGFAEKEYKNLLARIEFETARAGMDVLGDVPFESNIAWISGFIPEEDLGLLKKAAAKNDWALVSEDPEPEDMVPTKLRNNRFVNLINPLTDFLELVPAYHEPDISFWFLIFFTVFFGMIFGDAAYGAIFIIIAVIGIIRTAKKGVPQVLKLLLLLGTSNFIWGVLTCSWFGLNVEQLPVILEKISLPLISSVTAAKSAYDDGIVRQNLIIFCFTLALLQLSIGHIIVISRCRTLKLLADVGSICMLLGMYGVVLSLIASNEYRQIPLFRPCVYFLGGGFVLNFIFVNYDGSIGRSVIESFKNFISMFLGIANVFGDLMS